MKKFTTYYCEACRWSHEEPRQWAMVPKCPECGAPLFYVKFEEDERQRADAIICRETP